MNENEVLAILAERGIGLSVAGCGCCGSPWLQITIDGVLVVDSEYAGIGKPLAPPNGEDDRA